MKWGAHSVSPIRYNGLKMLLIELQSRFFVFNSLLDLSKHAIKGLINLSKARRVSINIFNDLQNRVNEGENVFANKRKLQVKNIIIFKKSASA